MLDVFFNPVGWLCSFILFAMCLYVAVQFWRWLWKTK